MGPLKITKSFPRLPNTLGLEVFGPQKHTYNTEPQEVFGRLGIILGLFFGTLSNHQKIEETPRSHTCTLTVFIGVHLGILGDYNPWPINTKYIGLI